MTKKRCVILIVALTAVFATVFVLTHLPKEMNGTMTVCTADGETAEFSYDLQYYPNWTLPSYVKGKVYFDGVEYIDQYTTCKTFGVSGNRLFPRNWFKDKDDSPYNLIFYKAGQKDFISAVSGSIKFYAQEMNNDMDRVFLGYMDKSNEVNQVVRAVFFAGPATNAEEAKQIIQAFGYKVD